MNNVFVESNPDWSGLLQENQINKGILRTRTATEVRRQAELMPDPVQLHELIIEGEITILFADTGIGKTVFAVQIAIHIAKQGYTALYIDLELSDKQFQKRYPEIEFPDTLYRSDYSDIVSLPEGITYEEFFIQSLIETIKEIGAKFVVIDNMTKLAAGDTDSAKTAIPVMEALTKIKREMGTTFLVLEHNKKVDTSRPISLNDLQGSKMKSNFADAVFSIGRCQSDKNLRYVKQVKVRAAELIYDSENVKTFDLKMEDGLLQFVQVGYGNEFNFLKLDSESYKSDKKLQAMELRSQGKGNSEIGRIMGVSEGAVRKWLKT